MADIELRLGNDVLVVQGAMGSMLLADGFEGCLPFLNLTEPETIEELHRRYRAAGADCAVTNTFLATSSRLAEHGLAAHTDAINVEGVRIAQAVGFPHVLAVMGPAGVPVEPGSGRAALRAQQPEVEAAQVAAGPAPHYAVAVEQYAEQAAALASAGPDALFLMTFTDLDDVLAAVEGTRQATSLPVIACIAPVPTGEGEGAFEPDPAEAARLLEQAGAAAVGCNCTSVEDAVAILEQMRPATGLPLVACPHAGIPSTAPDGSLVYPVKPQDFADASLRLLRAGARVIGACCGSTPAATGAIYATVGGVVFPEA